MQFEIVSYSSKGIRGVSILHGEKSITWDTLGYQAASIPACSKLFNNINDILADLDEDTQDKIFECYQDIEETLQEVFDAKEIHNRINAAAIRIYSLIPYEVFEKYVRYSGKVILPNNLKTEYTEKDTYSLNFKERTYLKPDFVNLAIAILGYRLIVPVWGCFLSMAANISGNNFKEQRALDLLEGSSIATWPGVERLMVYIGSNIMIGKSSISALLGGLSSTEIPGHLTSLAIVRKVALATLEMTNESDNVVKIIYNFVNGSEKRMDNRFEGAIGLKTLHKDGKDDDNSSVFDMIKVNEEIRTDIRITLEEYVNDYEKLALRSYPDVDLSILEQLMTQAATVKPLDIKMPQTVLSQWVLGNVLAPRSIVVLPVKQQIICLIVAQAILWSRGFNELALLMTAMPVNLNENPDWIVEEARGKISRATMQTLEEMYPHYRREPRKSDYDKRVVLPAKAIDTVVSELNQYGWKVKVTQAMRRQMTDIETVKVTTQRQLTISYDIKEILARLIVTLYSI